MLGDAGSEAELFVTDDFEDVLLSEVQGLVTASRLTREFDPDLRVRHFEEDEALRKRNAAAKAAGRWCACCSCNVSWASLHCSRTADYGSLLLVSTVSYQFECKSVIFHICASCLSAGKPLEYFFRHLYLPEQGMFKALPENLDLGVYKEEQAAPVELAMTDNKEGFIKQGVTYK